MNYKTTVFLSIALGAVLLIAAIAGMRYMNPAPEGYRSSFETAKEQTTPQPTQTATPKPTEEPFTGFYDTEAMTLKERIHTPEGFHREEVETDSLPIWKLEKEQALAAMNIPVKQHSVC